MFVNFWMYFLGFWDLSDAFLMIVLSKSVFIFTRKYVRVQLHTINLLTRTILESLPEVFGPFGYVSDIRFAEINFFFIKLNFGLTKRTLV